MSVLSLNVAALHLLSPGNPSALDQLFVSRAGVTVCRCAGVIFIIKTSSNTLPSPHPACQFVASTSINAATVQALLLVSALCLPVRNLVFSVLVTLPPLTPALPHPSHLPSLLLVHYSCHFASERPSAKYPWNYHWICSSQCHHLTVSCN